MPNPYFCIQIKLSQSFENEYSSKQLVRLKKNPRLWQFITNIDTFDDLIDSSDTKSPNHLKSSIWPGFINKGSRNVPKSKDSSPTFLEKDCLDKNISTTSLESILKIRDFQVYQRYDVATLGAKSGRVQYKKSQ